MRHLFLSLFLLLVFGVNTFAGDTAVSPNILQSFQNKFSSAKEITWTAGPEIYKAEFVYRSQYLAAFYDAEGNMLALTKNILSTQLPLFLGGSLRENYQDYWISDVIEFSTEDGTSYYATVENAEQKLVLKSSQNSWVVSKKIKK
ncbi:MAG TPA: hypothetical protein VFS22_00665 [Flavisolibacter sp.]|nr:hypothetical protein [Flavisolibacter sp.]